MSASKVIPKLHIVLNRVQSGTGVDAISWSVTMKASDATRGRSLGYRAAGTIGRDLAGFQFETEPEVHDENRPVWTTMNQTDRLTSAKR